MDETLKRTIFETISEVFETMFFTFITPSAAFPEDPGLLKKADFIEAVITFTCKTEGKVTIYFPRALAKDITVNFLGLEEGEVEERQVIDTMRETVNMAIGSLLGKIDPEGECSLGIPEARAMNDFSPAVLKNEKGLCLFNSTYGLLSVVFIGG